MVDSTSPQQGDDPVVMDAGPAVEVAAGGPGVVIDATASSRTPGQGQGHGDAVGQGHAPDPAAPAAHHLKRGKSIKLTR